MASVVLASSQPEVREIPDCRELDLDSVNKVCQGSYQAMVYGTKTCQYVQVHNILADLASSKKINLKKVFDWTVSSKMFGSSERNTLEGRDLNELSSSISFSYPKCYTHPCKSTLTNVVLENYKRIEEGRGIIPILFCIDIDGSQHQITMEDIAAHDSSSILHPKGLRVTGSELRRAYKLCTHKNEKIRKAAEATFRFVRLKHIKKHKYALEQVAAPWANREEAAKIWKEHRGVRRCFPKDPEDKWENQLDKKIAAFKKETPAALPTFFAPVPVLATKCKTSLSKQPPRP